MQACPAVCQIQVYTMPAGHCLDVQVIFHMSGFGHTSFQGAGLQLRSPEGCCYGSLSEHMKWGKWESRRKIDWSSFHWKSIGGSWVGVLEYFGLLGCSFLHTCSGCIWYLIIVAKNIWFHSSYFPYLSLFVHHRWCFWYLRELWIYIQ